MVSITVLAIAALTAFQRNAYGAEFPVEWTFVSTGTIHKQDNEIYLEFKQGDLYYCYWVTTEQIEALPNEPANLLVYAATQPNWAIPCGGRWRVALNPRDTTGINDRPIYVINADGTIDKTRTIGRAAFQRPCGKFIAPISKNREYREVLLGGRYGAGVCERY